MKLLFRQRLFSWFDSYDIYDPDGNTVFTVQGKMAWGHKLEIYDAVGNHLGTVREEIFTFLPRFTMYIGAQQIGQIKKEFTFFRPQFTLDCNGWNVSGDLMQWDYDVTDAAGTPVMQLSKELFNWTDTYIMEIYNPQNALLCLMIVLAIDAAKCSANS